MQEIIWEVKPDLIIETGIARGGSLVLSASLLALLDLSEQLSSGNSGPIESPQRKVIGIDIDIRSHNREAIEKHPLFPWIEMVEGSSISPDVVDVVSREAERADRVLVMLDSNHTHDHVLEELRAYAPLASKGSYVIVFDSIVEDMPQGFYPDRMWDRGNNPKTAIREFLGESSDFEVDLNYQDKLLITVCPEGFLRKA
jgi:cephalosporin hydroxylase